MRAILRGPLVLAAAWLGFVVLGEEPTVPGVEEYRRHALTRAGDAVRGAVLFADDARLACAKCHSIDGSAGRAGPDLGTAGDGLGRRDLVESILAPSARIALGYGTVLVETRDGRTIQGVLKQVDATGLRLMGGDGVLVGIGRDEIVKREGVNGSLMPEGLQVGMTLQEFTDLIEYLTTLKQSGTALAGHRGMPREIPELVRPVKLQPFFREEFKVPRGGVQTGLTAMHQVPGMTHRFLVLHQKGLIWVVEKLAEAEARNVFLDLSGEVFSDRGPNGLLDLTFHPRCRENRKYYLKYQVFEEGTVATVVVERQLSGDFRSDSGQTGRRLIKIASVAEDHSGGCMQFGPDGFLYFAMGDTGPHNDPNGHAQDMGLLLGKMMRIDVDRTGAGREYGVPTDNPYVGRAGVPPEIWATGFRNPWRFTFDPLNGDLWLADVGQDRVEEVVLVRKGENHGWSVFEGFEPFSNQYRKEGTTYTPPVFAYGRKYGNSITGGHVYRADPASSFYGVYLCGDFTSKRIFGVTRKNGLLERVRQIGMAPQGLVSFGRDEAGRHYVVGYEGMIYQIDFSEADFDGVEGD